MRNGKISNQQKQYAHRKTLYLSLAWGAFFACGGLFWLLFSWDIPDLALPLIGTGMLAFLFWLLFFCKTKVSFFDLRQRYQSLLDRSSGPETTRCRFDNRWLDALVSHGYKLHVENARFAVFYAVRKSLAKTTLLSANLLVILCIVREPGLDFYAEETETEFKKLWRSLEKEHRLNKQVILQFKKYGAFTEDIRDSLNRIIAYKEGDNYLVNINCGYFPEGQTLYYLHSGDYAPNLYYKLGGDILREITDY